MSQVVQQAGEAAPKEGRDETSRMLNLGVRVDLPGDETCYVKELSLEDSIRCVADLVALSTKLNAGKAEKGDGKQFMYALLNDPETVKAYYKVMSLSSNVPVERLKDYGLTTHLKLMAAFKQVLDWEELKETFFHLIPQEALQKLTAKKS